MTGPKPINTRPVRLPDITVGRRPNAIELAFRQMGMNPEDRQASQAEFAERMRQFSPAFYKALPGGAVQGLGSAVTDVASVDLPFLPPLLSGVRATGDDLTTAFANHLHALLGADPESEGGAVGQEVAAMSAPLIVPDALLAMIPGRSPRIGVPEMGSMRRDVPMVQVPERVPRLPEYPNRRGPPVSVPARAIAPPPEPGYWPSYPSEAEAAALWQETRRRLLATPPGTAATAARRP